MSFADRCDGCGHFRPCLCMVGQEVVRASEAEQVQPVPDRLEEMFRRQQELMHDLIQVDKLPEYPIDITSKHGQRQIKELTWAMVEEMAEAVILLKNHVHHLTDRTDVDMEHFKEELADALAYFLEICVYADIGPKELFSEYCKKNAVVRGRVRDGY